jgi:hypothetical protein
MVNREVRGIPLWLIREYLEELGGTAKDDCNISGEGRVSGASRVSGESGVSGEGWTAQLEQIEDFQIGSLVIGQVRVVLEGDVNELVIGLDDKLLRAGG